MGTDLQICFVGDSFVNGTGDPECRGWAGRVCATAGRRGYPLTYYNLGIRRATSREIKAWWFGDVSRRLPEDCDRRIVFSFGVNDTTLENGSVRVSLEETLRNAHSIFESAKKLAPIVMIGPPPVGDAEQNIRIGHLTVQLAALCHNMNVPFLETFTPLKNTRIWMQGIQANDLYHPGAEGYAEFARLVETWQAWISWFK